MKERKFCKASKLVARLQEMIETHGDLPVIVDDADTGYPLQIGLVMKPSGHEDWFNHPCLAIVSTYDGEPDGFIEP